MALFDYNIRPSGGSNLGLNTGWGEMSNWGLPGDVPISPAYTPGLTGGGVNTQLGSPTSFVNTGLGGTGIGQGGPGFMSGINQSLRDSGFIGSEGQQGWGGLALGAAQGLGNAFMGMKQYGLAKDTLQNTRDQFNMNYGAQRDLTNSQLEDRQRARVTATAGGAESVEDYMKRNRIK